MKSAPPPMQLRCAIYTRVSTDHGLDQDFNSLDNQREAAEAYVKSQAHEGWQCLPDIYDDGGYSGGSLDRPALQRLLADIREKKLDVVVVYKVDRLTRSLADFAKLVELFDEHGVSFVSVTQAFNTTSSMGRLTLNVLLSFAQFEREVTAERIRDKIAASKRKGMRMGGPVPLGYIVENKRLIVHDHEAETVRLIFRRYLELGSIDKLLADLRERDIRTKRSLLSDGCTRGGIAFGRGALSYLLKNRVYIGEIVHKGTHYTGDHTAIVDASVFDAVESRLAAQAHAVRTSRISSSLLTGRIFDDRGNRMTPVSSKKGALRHRYYVSSVIFQARKHEAGSVPRVSAPEVEAEVMAALKQHLPDPDVNPQTRSDKNLVDEMLSRLVVRQGALNITLNTSDESKIVVVPWSPRPLRRQQEINHAGGSASISRPMRSETRARLVQGIAKARLWLHEVTVGTASTEEIALREGYSERMVRMTLSLAFLGPALIKAAVEGKLPEQAGLSKLVDMPPLWTKQIEMLAVTHPLQLQRSCPTLSS